MKKAMLTSFAIAMLITGGIIASVTLSPSPASAQGSLIYECSATPCTNSQEFEVFDGYGNPIFSIGEYGGDAVFGDNSSIFAPGNIYNPSIVESYTTPSGYATAHDGTDATCVEPALWIAPQGFYSCVGTSWTPVISFSALDKILAAMEAKK